MGSGTRAFWKELIQELSGERDFAVWPFGGGPESLVATRRAVHCESHARLAHAAALADDLPTCILAGPKTVREWRDAACRRLEEAAWVRECRVDLGGLDGARANEDDFDALLTAAGVLRCVLEGRPL